MKPDIDLSQIDPDFSAPTRAPEPRWQPVGADTLPQEGRVVVWRIKEYRFWYDRDLNANTSDQRHILGSLKMVKGAFGTAVPVGVSVLIPRPSDRDEKVRFTEVEIGLDVLEAWMPL